MDSSTAYQKIIDCGIMPTTFVRESCETVELAKIFYENDLPVIEILQRTKNALEAVGRVKEALPDITVGAGTVLTVETARDAVKAGADYLVCPFYEQKLVDWSLEHEILIIPGCATITEISAGYTSGLRLFKYFPIKQLGGAEALRQLGEIYADALYVATGGVSYEDVLEYAPCGKIGAIGTVCMMPQRLIYEHEWKKIAALTRKTVAASLGLELAYVNENAEYGQALSLLAAYSLGSAGQPDIPERIKRLGEERNIILYTNSVVRALAWLKRRGADALVLESGDSGPEIADVRLSVFPETVRLVSKSCVYRA